MQDQKVDESVPNSERYVKTKNGRLMLKSKCASCGITKSKFVKNKQGGDIGEVLAKMGWEMGKTAVKKV